MVATIFPPEEVVDDESSSDTQTRNRYFRHSPVYEHKKPYKDRVYECIKEAISASLENTHLPKTT